MEAKTAAEVETTSGWQYSWPHLAVCLVLASLFTLTGITALDLGVGTFAAPDAGLWPILGSVVGLCLSGGLAATVLMGNYDRDAELFSDVKWIPTAVFVGTILGFLVVYPVVGFLVAAVPMSFVLLKYAGDANWIPSIAVAVTAPLVLFFTFSEVLDVQL